MRETLSKGPRSEEDLLKEQEEFFSRKSGGEVKPAATLVRKVSPPAEPPPPTTSKPMSKFALERQRKRETVGADTSAPGGNAGSGASVRESNVPSTAAASGGKSSGAHAERGATAAQGASGGSSRARKCTRIPPSKPVGEPMSVVRSHHPPSLSDTTIYIVYLQQTIFKGNNVHTRSTVLV